MQVDPQTEIRFYYDEHRFAHENKTRQAGWRIKAAYNPNVLTGNWTEERYKFLKYPQGPHHHNSSNRIEYQPYDSILHAPDVIIRHKGRLRNEGIDGEILTHHHDDAYLNNNVTVYDEQYNGRWREKNLPQLRSWNSRQIAWLPERSDHHVKVGATNFGLLPKKMNEWKKQVEDTNSDDYKTNYNTSYVKHDSQSYIHKMYGFDKDISISLDPTIKILRDLNLRGSRCLRLPEISTFPVKTVPNVPQIVPEETAANILQREPKQPVPELTDDKVKVVSPNVLVQ